MIDVSEEVKDLLKNTECRKEVVISFPNGEHEDITNDSIIAESLEFTESICSQQELEFGLCEASVLKFSAFNLENINGYKIKADIYIYNNFNNAFNIPLGQFYIAECKKNESNLRLRNIVAYSNQGYNDLNYPDSLKEIVDSIPYGLENGLPVPELSASDIKDSIITDNLFNEIQTKSLNDSEKETSYSVRYYIKSGKILDYSGFGIYDDIIDGKLTDVSLDDINIKNGNIITTDLNGFTSIKTIEINVNPTSELTQLQRRITYYDGYERFGKDYSLNMVDYLNKNDYYLIKNKYEVNTIREIASVSYDRISIVEDKTLWLKVPANTICYPKDENTFLSVDTDSFISIIYDKINKSIKNIIWFIVKPYINYTINLTTYNISESGVYIHTEATEGFTYTVSSSNVSYFDNLKSALEGTKYYDLILSTDLPENNYDKYRDEYDLDVIKQVIKYSEDLYSEYNDFSEFDTYLNTIVTGRKLNLYFTNGNGKITVTGKIEDEDFINKIGILKCESIDNFYNSIPAEIIDKIQSIDKGLIYFIPSETNGYNISDIKDFLHLKAEINLVSKADYGTYLESSEIKLRYVYVRAKNGYYNDYYNIDMLSENYSSFIIPQFKHEYSDGYTLRPGYEFIYDNYNSSAANPEIYKIPFLFSPYKIEISENNNVIYSYEASKDNIGDIKYGVRDLKTDGIMIKMEQGKTLSTTGGVYFTMCSLSEFEKYLEAELELEGKFGKYDRYGNFVEYSFGADMLYPSEETYPGQDVFPGGNGNIGAELYTKKIYKNAWYDDEPTKLYGTIKCTYKNKEGNDVETYKNIYEIDDASKYREYDISSNYLIKNFTYSASEIENILNIMAENIKYIQYMPTKLSAKGLPYVEAGDMIQVITDGETIKTYALRRTMKGIQQLTDSIIAN